MTGGLCCSYLTGMIESSPIPVWVTAVDYKGGAVAHGRGFTEVGDRVEFAVEPRALWAISEALDAGDGPVMLAIPTWWVSFIAKRGGR